jgi:hypothetical protein
MLFNAEKQIKRVAVTNVPDLDLMKQAQSELSNAISSLEEAKLDDSMYSLLTLMVLLAGVLHRHEEIFPR